MKSQAPLTSIRLNVSNRYQLLENRVAVLLCSQCEPLRLVYSVERHRSNFNSIVQPDVFDSVRLETLPKSYERLPYNGKFLWPH